MRNSTEDFHRKYAAKIRFYFEKSKKNMLKKKNDALYFKISILPLECDIASLSFALFRQIWGDEGIFLIPALKQAEEDGHEEEQRYRSYNHSAQYARTNGQVALGSCSR